MHTVAAVGREAACCSDAHAPNGALQRADHEVAGRPQQHDDEKDTYAPAKAARATRSTAAGVRRTGCCRTRCPAAPGCSHQGGPWGCLGPRTRGVGGEGGGLEGRGEVCLPEGGGGGGAGRRAAAGGVETPCPCPRLQPYPGSEAVGMRRRRFHLHIGIGAVETTHTKVKNATRPQHTQMLHVGAVRAAHAHATAT